MTVANLQSLLTQGFNEDLSYLEFRAILIDFKEAGGLPDQALSTLKTLQESFNAEAIQNRIDELIDLVEGQGIKSLKIW